MGIAFRLHFEHGTRQTIGKELLVCVYHRASKLDRICRRLGLTPISDFRDGLDGKEERFPSHVTDTVKIVVKSKLWFPIDDGLATLVPLVDWLEQNPTRFGLWSDEYPGVLEELRRCIAELKSQPDDISRFNFGAVSTELG